MQLTQDQVKAIISDGGASAIDAAKSEVDKIAGQINAGLAENEVERVTYSISLKITTTVDVNQRRITTTGAYGAKTPNLGKSGDKVEREIDDPNQGKLPFDNTGGKDSPEETETTEE